VLTWQTGFPAAVSFAAGFPNYRPGEGGAGRLLARREVDAALIIAADPLPHLAPAAAAHLRLIPTIVLDDRDTATAQAATVVLPSAAFGIETSGTTFRSDGVALPLRPALPAQRSAAADLLQRLADCLARP
jgi:formylmethanofuran dehydrogenase subunit B